MVTPTVWQVLAELSRRDLVSATWLPDRATRAERERAHYRPYLVLRVCRP
jgi:hypothetical protein